MNNRVEYLPSLTALLGSLNGMCAGQSDGFSPQSLTTNKHTESEFKWIWQHSISNLEQLYPLRTQCSYTSMSYLYR